MRRAVKPAVPPSLYRHFAIVTLVLTAGVAMFAEGEGREAQAAQARSSAPAPATFANADEAAENAWDGWADDGTDSGGGSFGEAPGSVFAGADSSVPPNLESTIAPVAAEDTESLSEVDRALLRQGLRESLLPRPQGRRERGEV
jgi:hypothetical protein